MDDKKLYRFSPIENRDELYQAVEYVAKKATKLYFRATGGVGDDLIESLTIFAHFPDEYEHLKDILKELGEPYNENNGPRVKLYTPITVHNAKVERNNKPHEYSTTITYLRIRKPDPYRMQVGCCDFNDSFDTQDFWAAVAVPNDQESPRLIRREDFGMLEFFAPDIDVLAYIVKDK